MKVLIITLLDLTLCTGFISQNSGDFPQPFFLTEETIQKLFIQTAKLVLFLK